MHPYDDQYVKFMEGTGAEYVDFPSGPDRQGEAIHRDGGMKVHVVKQCGNPVKVQIISRAVIAFKTEIDL